MPMRNGKEVTLHQMGFAQATNKPSDMHRSDEIPVYTHSIQRLTLLERIDISLGRKMTTWGLLLVLVGMGMTVGFYLSLKLWGPHL